MLIAIGGVILLAEIIIGARKDWWINENKGGVSN
jgi:hypothetical protein